MEKSADFAGFSREKSQNSRKNRPISWDFWGRKVKIHRKNWPISRDFRGKKSNFKGFSGANSEKTHYSIQILRKSEISGGNFTKKQSVKKQLILLDFLGQILLKSINFASI